MPKKSPTNTVISKNKKTKRFSAELSAENLSANLRQHVIARSVFTTWQSHSIKLTPYFLIVLLIFLRFYKAADWFSFNFDEEYQALLAWSQVKDFHPIWIGVSASNFGFYLGPAFTYLNALLFWISKGDLSILAYFASLFGIITTFSVYYVTKEVFSKKAAFIAAIVYGFSALIITFDRRFWNPTPIAFITIWLFFSLQRAIKDSRWFILTAILMAASLHIHLSLMVYWPLVLYRVARQFKKISVSTWIGSIAAYLVAVSPLMVFDFYHNYDNLLGPIRYIFSPKTSGSVFALDQLSYHLRNIWLSLGRILYLDWGTTIQDEHGLGVHAIMTRPPFLISLISTIALVWYLFKCFIEKHISILMVMLLSILCLFVFYPSAVHEYYLLSFFLLMSIVFGLFLEKLPRTFLVSLLLLFIFYNSLAILTLNQSLHGLTSRKNLVMLVMETVGDKPYSLEVGDNTLGSYRADGGWYYLFSIYGNAPVLSKADEFFGWIYQKDTIYEPPIYKVVIDRNGDTGAFAAQVVRIN